MEPLRARQVHLDFHTSPLIPEIGREFSRENFQQALREGHVSSITVFAKCHHGLCYYPTQVGTMHPHLDFDLLGSQLDAAHEIGVHAPIYITAGWSDLDAQTHPEWRCRRQDGSLTGTNYDLEAESETEKPACSWIDLCLNDGSYAHHIYQLTREICQRYRQVDGLFFDICFLQEACYCDECREGMRQMGLDPNREEDARRYYILKHQAFMENCGKILHEYHPDATLFFNSGGADQYRPEYHGGSTHFELEDLPTAWGGYDKMPPRAKYFSHTGKHYLGMTGKFHTEWGEFGGYKLPEALCYETAAMMSYGARCSVGDQLHPSGKMELETYRNLGKAYGYVEQLEPYCLDGETVSTLGVVLSGNAQSDQGILQMLLESQQEFDLVLGDNYDPFDVVIFPDCVTLTDAGVSALTRFLDRGGRVLLTGESLVKNGQFQIDTGALYQGHGAYRQDYLLPGDSVSQGMVRAPLLCYESAARLQVTDGEVLAETLPPYFNRTYGHYCSHRNTPYQPVQETLPALVRKGGVLCLAHWVGRMYQEYGSAYHRRYFLNALALLYPHPVVEVDLMTSGRISLIRQRKQNRYCLNLLYAAPAQRNRVAVIEDLPELREIPVTVRVPEAICAVALGPEQIPVPFTQDALGVHFEVPRLRCHQLVTLSYEADAGSIEK